MSSTAEGIVAARAGLVESPRRAGIDSRAEAGDRGLAPGSGLASDTRPVTQPGIASGTGPDTGPDIAPGLWRRLIGSGNWIGVLLPLSILALWQTAVSQRWIDPVFLPAPLKVVQAFWTMLTGQGLVTDFLVSINIVGQAFLYGSLLGVGLGLASGLSQRVERFFGPTFDTVRHIPGIAWLPLIVLWLGLGAPAKILVIAKSVFFPVYLNTLQGIRNVDKNYVELAEALTLTRAQLVRKVILPAAMPNIMVALRYSAGLAWALVVVAEGLSGLEGLGFLIFRAQSLLMTDQLLVCMVVIGLIGFAIDRSMYYLQRRVLRWKQGFEG